MLRYFLLPFIAICLMASCSNASNQAVSNEIVAAEPVPGDSLPTRRELWTNFYDGGKVLFIVSSETEEYERYVKLFASYPKEEQSMNIVLKKASDVTAQELAENALYIAGTPAHNEALTKLATQLPFGASDAGITFREKQYQGDQDLFLLNFYPNPEHPQLPIFVVSGNSEQRIFEYISKRMEGSRRWFFWNSFSYQIYKADQRVVLGNFSAMPETRWQWDAEEHWDFSGKPLHESSTTHFEGAALTDQVTATELASLLEESEAVYAKVEAFLGEQALTDLPKVNYNVYKSGESKGLALNNSKPVHVNHDSWTVNVVSNAIYRDHILHLENELVLRKVLGKPKSMALERGLAIQLGSEWPRKGYKYWAARLFESENLPAIEALLNDEKYQKESPLIMPIVAAAFVDFSIGKYGAEAFKENYLTWQPDAKTLKKLKPEWERYLKSLAAKHPLEKRGASDEVNYYKGYNFAHEGYQIYDGYLGSKAKTSLDYLQQMGVNSVAIVPYSGMRNPKVPKPIGFAQGAGSETDESVVFSGYQSKQRGMTTVLKPQIWISGSWPGDVDMKNDAEWNEWFDYYYRWIRHYALLGEIYQYDVFCVGVEFTQATLKREGHWREIFRRMRGIYQGKLTYAANWGDEFEKIKFWDALDYIGLNCYYPLSGSNAPSDEDLRKGARDINHRVEKVYKATGKPILFTEIGFRSIAQPWIHPHDYPKGQEPAEEGQYRCYQIIFEELGSQPWCKGFLWWKWPSYLNYSKQNRGGYSTYNRKTEALVRDWFNKLPE